MMLIAKSMTQGSPRERLARQRLVWQSAVASAAVIAALGWAIMPISLTPEPTRPTTSAKPSRATETPAPTAPLALWKRLGPDAPVATAAPVAVTLFSVMHQDNVLIAVLDFKEQGGLFYGKIGETVNGVTVKSITENSVDVVISGATTRLNIGP